MSLSYREIIEFRYVGLFRISKKISYRTSNIEYLNILKASDLFCLFSPKILWKLWNFSENTPKILKIPKNCRKFWNFAKNSSKEGLFWGQNIVSYRGKKPNIVLISYQVKKKRIAQGCSGTIAFRICMTCYRWKSTVLPGKLFLQKNAEKQAFFEDTIPGYPDFGRSCMPNYWD